MGYRPAMSNPSEETFRSDLRDGGRNDEGHEGANAIPSPGQSAGTGGIGSMEGQQAGSMPDGGRAPYSLTSEEQRSDPPPASPSGT